MINTNNPIISWLRNNKIIVFIIVLAFVLRIAMLFAVYSNAGDYSQFIENIKADGYYDIGYTLANEGVFAIDDVEVLDSVRTPGYPLIVAGFLIAFGSVWFLLIVQIFIASIIPLLVYRLSLYVSEYKKIAYASALVFAIEPLGVLISVRLLTEIFFTGLFLLFTLFVFRFFYSYTNKAQILNSVFAGISLGAATLIRPTTLYFIPFIIIAYILYRFISKQIINWRSLSIFAIVVILILSPWYYRNYKTYEVIKFSAIPQQVMFWYLAPSVLAVENDIAFRESQISFFEKEGFNGDDNFTVENASKYQERAMEVILENPIGLIRVSLTSMSTFFSHDGVFDVLHLSGVIDPEQEIITLSELFEGSIFENLNDIIKSPLAIGVLFRIFWVAISLLFFAYIILLAKKRKLSKEVVFIFICVLYFALTTISNGYGVNARFRFPINAFLFIIAIHSLQSFVPRLGLNR